MASAFTPASTLPRDDPPVAGPSNAAAGGSSSTTTSSGPSLRNASNAHLPMPQGNVNGSQADTAGSGAGAGAEKATTPAKPVKPVNMASGKRSIVVNACQRGNPILKAIQGVGWEYGDIVPDYQVGQNTCALFLSLKYHRLHPEYLYNRIEKLRGMYMLRILLLMCDVNEHQEPIREITKICLINELTVVVAWSNEEAATYLATYKAFEHRPPDLLKERVHNDYASRLQGVLTSVRGVNKTDVITLSTNFGSFKSLTHATPEQLALCPGLGDIKVRRLSDAFSLPFKVSSDRSATPRRERGSKGKSKSALLSGKKVVPPIEIGQMSLRESVERARSASVSASPAPRGREASEAIDVDEEDAEPGLEREEGEATRPTAYSPEWPAEADVLDTSNSLLEGGAGPAADTSANTGEKRVWHDPLESSDEEDEEEASSASKKRKTAE